MDEEKFQRTIEIILEQQATFYSGLQELQEVQKEAEKRTNELGLACLNLYNSSVEQGKNIAELTEDIRELREGQKETDERFRETDERFRETDERLNAVIFMAEKFFGGQNGKSK